MRALPRCFPMPLPRCLPFLFPDALPSAFSALPMPLPRCFPLLFLFLLLLLLLSFFIFQAIDSWLLSPLTEILIQIHLSRSWTWWCKHKINGRSCVVKKRHLSSCFTFFEIIFPFFKREMIPGSLFLVPWHDVLKSDFPLEKRIRINKWWETYAYYWRLLDDLLFYQLLVGLTINLSLIIAALIEMLPAT